MIISRQKVPDLTIGDRKGQWRKRGRNGKALVNKVMVTFYYTLCIITFYGMQSAIISPYCVLPYCACTVADLWLYNALPTQPMV